MRKFFLNINSGTTMAIIVIFSILFFLPFFVSANNLSAICSANPLAVEVGEQVVWKVIPQGGIGVYEYSWSGDDGIFGNKQSIAKIYENKGQKKATVIVSSGEEIVTPTCIVDVSERDPLLSVSCFPQTSVVSLSQEVLWSAEARGGDGKYTYSWIGDEGLGDKNNSFGRTSRRKTISKTYESIGIKKASVVVSSGNQSLSRTCNVTVELDPPLTGLCYPNNRSATLGEPIIWTAEARGGSGEYDYSWSGAETKRGFRRNKQAASTIYETSGLKTVSVIISSGGQTINRSCSVNIGSVLGVDNENRYNNFSDDFTEESYQEGSVGLDGRTFSDSNSNNNSNESGLPTTRIFSKSWMIFMILFFILSAITIFIFVSVLKKRLKKETNSSTSDFDDNGLDRSIVKIIQAEAREKGVLLSLDAITLLMEETEKSPSAALRILERIITDIKNLPLSVLPGEERAPLISKEMVEDFFLKRKSKDI